MRLTIRKCDDMGDWWVIERAEHDGRRWMEPTEYGSAFMTSARFSDADVEGTSEEILEIAKAIKERGSVSFKRCRVSFNGDTTLFCSPRNSEVDGECTLAEADDLADLILRTLGGRELA